MHSDGVEELETGGSLRTSMIWLPVDAWPLRWLIYVSGTDRTRAKLYDIAWKRGCCSAMYIEHARLDSPLCAVLNNLSFSCAKDRRTALPSSQRPCHSLP